MSRLNRYRLIKDRRTNQDYIHRYYLLFKNRKRFPFNCMLHKIVRSDDPVYHDHPWPYMTIILKGGYWEHTPVFHNGEVTSDICKWRGPGSIICRKSKTYHWLEIGANSGSATTLFFTGPRIRDWGFLINNIWIKHDECLSNWGSLVKPKTKTKKQMVTSSYR